MTNFVNIVNDFIYIFVIYKSYIFIIYNYLSRVNILILYYGNIFLKSQSFSVNYSSFFNYY